VFAFHVTFIQLIAKTGGFQVANFAKIHERANQHSTLDDDEQNISSQTLPRRSHFTCTGKATLLYLSCQHTHT